MPFSLLNAVCPKTMPLRAVCRLIVAVVLIISFTRDSVWACACGCGVFDTGSSGMLPTEEGGMAFLEYDFMNQNRNWKGSSSAPEEDNEDKEIRTNFYTAGVRYMFGRRWGVRADIPFWNRRFETLDEDGNRVGFIAPEPRHEADAMRAA